MFRITLLLIPVLLLSCTSRQEKMLSQFEKYNKHLQMESKAGIDSLQSAYLIDSIPDSISFKWHKFAVEFPQHPQSEKMLYLATLKAEQAGRYLDCGKWCEEYIAMYPNSPNVFSATVAAASNYEKAKAFDKAIEFNERIVKNYPKNPIAKHAALVLKMLKMGLTSDEQQFEYIMKHRDSMAQ